MPKRVAACVLAGLLLVSASASAELVRDLYTQSVLVANQSEETRREAAQEALKKVLQRVSGTPDVLHSPELMGLITRAESYLESFHYESSDELIDYRGQEVKASKLVLRFSGSTLETFLRQVRLPVWPANRPSILVWLVTDSAAGKQMVSPEMADPVAELLPQVARDLGLPISRPLFDLQDQMAANAADFWRLDRRAVRAASQRYPVDAVLIGRYSQTSTGLWLATWSLEHKNNQNIFDSQAIEPEALLTDGLQQVAAYLAGLYGVVASEVPGNALVLELSSVATFADYIGALDYLNGLTIVSHVAPHSIAGDRMRLQLFVEGGRSVLLDTLELDRRLDRVASPIDGLGQVSVNPPGSLENPLKFIWQGSRAR
ncbi:MAG: DUF2066 domain-containing protein [Candidatus Pelagadaptatus aseana]